MSNDGGAPYSFESLVSLDAGANTVVVEAKDGKNNTATKTYAVTATGTAKTFEYDANGNGSTRSIAAYTVAREGARSRRRAKHARTAASASESAGRAPRASWRRSSASTTGASRPFPASERRAAGRLGPRSLASARVMDAESENSDIGPGEF
jgi:hypothetical protein